MRVCVNGLSHFVIFLLYRSFFSCKERLLHPISIWSVTVAYSLIYRHRIIAGLYLETLLGCCHTIGTLQRCWLLETHLAQGLQGWSFCCRVATEGLVCEMWGKDGVLLQKPLTKTGTHTLETPRTRTSSLCSITNQLNVQLAPR
jgi:hypothetical protein